VLQTLDNLSHSMSTKFIPANI